MNCRNINLDAVSPQSKKVDAVSPQLLPLRNSRQRYLLTVKGQMLYKEE